jgi:hypothetical protein
MKAAAVFAESVRRELRHLPAEVVADLTDGLESDIASSLLDGVVLANPSGYANDLLRGAGLAVEKSSPSNMSFVVEVEKRLVGLWNPIRNFTMGLAPAWWLARAWIVTQVLGAALNGRDDTRVLVGQWGEKPYLGIVVFVIALYFSVVLGRRQLEKSYFKLVFTAGLVVAGVVIATGQFQPGVNYYEASSEPVPCMLPPDFVGMSVTEIKNLQIDGHIPFAIEFFAKSTNANMTQTIWDQVSSDFRKFRVVEQENPSLMECHDEALALIIDEVALVEAPTTTTVAPTTTPTIAPSVAPTTTSKTSIEQQSTTTSPGPQTTTMEKER